MAKIKKTVKQKDGSSVTIDIDDGVAGVSGSLDPQSLGGLLGQQAAQQTQGGPALPPPDPSMGFVPQGAAPAPIPTDSGVGFGPEIQASLDNRSIQPPLGSPDEVLAQFTRQNEARRGTPGGIAQADFNRDERRRHEGFSRGGELELFNRERQLSSELEAAQENLAIAGALKGEGQRGEEEAAVAGIQEQLDAVRAEQEQPQPGEPPDPIEAISQEIENAPFAPTDASVEEIGAAEEEIKAGNPLAVGAVANTVYANDRTVDKTMDQVLAERLANLTETFEGPERERRERRLTQMQRQLDQGYQQQKRAVNAMRESALIATVISAFVGNQAAAQQSLSSYTEASAGLVHLNDGYVRASVQVSERGLESPTLAGSRRSAAAVLDAGVPDVTGTLGADAGADTATSPSEFKNIRADAENIFAQGKKNQSELVRLEGGNSTQRQVAQEILGMVLRDQKGLDFWFSRDQVISERARQAAQALVNVPGFNSVNVREILSALAAEPETDQADLANVLLSAVRSGDQKAIEDAVLEIGAGR